jgi:hypothetical protein
MQHALIPPPSVSEKVTGGQNCTIFTHNDLLIQYTSPDLMKYWRFFEKSWKADRDCNFTIKEMAMSTTSKTFFPHMVIISSGKNGFPVIDQFFTPNIEFWQSQTNRIIEQTPTDRGLIETEGFCIEISSDYILILAVTGHGCFNALQYILKMLRAAVVQQVQLQGQRIFDYPRMQYRGFHLDMKDLTPTFEYIKELIPFLGRYQYNYLLIEYEDKFPYKGDLACIPHKYAWTEAQFAEIQALCKTFFIEITPLIQVFGHVERFILKEPLKKLQEQPDGIPKDFDKYNVWSLCPLHPETETFVAEMVKQIAAAHPDAKYLHVGADEVYQLGTCPKCKAYLQSHTKSELYIQHMNMVAKHVLAAGKKPIMWHDYLLHYPEALNQLDRRIVIMYWIYTDGGDRIHPAIPPQSSSTTLPYFDYFHKQGHEIIGAPSSSADFDGFVPNYQTRILNISKHATRVRESGALGELITSWVVCLNPLETQKILIAMGGALMWSPLSTWNPFPWKEFDSAVQMELLKIPPSQQINWLENFSFATERARRLWPSADALSRLPVAITQTDQLLQLTQDIPAKQIMQSLRYGLDWRMLFGEPIRILLKYYLKYAESDDDELNPFPTVDLLNEHAEMLADRVYKQTEFLERAKKYYIETTRQILPGEFDGILGLPRYNLLPEIARMGHHLWQVAENLDQFLLGLFRQDFPV